MDHLLQPPGSVPTAHLLDGDIRRLSFQRDGFPMEPPDHPLEGFPDVVRFLDRLNADWIRAARRISPRVLMELLDLTGPEVASLFASLDPQAPAFLPVSWAGEEASAN